MEQLTAEQLSTFLTLPKDNAIESELGLPPSNDSLIVLLMRSSLSVVDGYPGNSQQLSDNLKQAKTYLFQLETVRFLITAGSSQLYAHEARAKSIGVHSFLDIAMSQCKDLAPPAIAGLLQRIVVNAAPPLSLRLYIDTRAVLQIVRTAAVSVLTLPYQAYVHLVSRRKDEKHQAPQMEGPLAEACLLALLSLLFYAPPQGYHYNPFKAALDQLQDADDVMPEEAIEVGKPLTSVVSYNALYAALGRSLLGNEGSVLLLYALLHNCSGFHEYCLVRSDLDTLLMPLLESLYSVSQRTPNQLYISLIIILILSQDASFAQNIHRVAIPSAPFYKERHVRATTLGSLVVLMLLRTAHYNVATMKDVYLHTNTLAALANLAPYVSGLSAHASQRLVSLFHLLAKRYTKLQQQGVPSPTSTTAPPPVEGHDLETQLYADFLRIVSEIINSILYNGLQSNYELVYTLLYKADVFEPWASHPRYAELMQNISAVVDYFGKRLEDTAQGGSFSPLISADSVLESIKLHSRGWRREKLNPLPELKFNYEEESSPEEFFIPYVWSLVVADSGLLFNVSAIVLFTPTEIDVI